MKPENRYFLALANKSLVPIFVTMLCLLCSQAAAGPHDKQVQEISATPLEVRITAPLHWERGCLVTALDRINHSSAPLFLTRMGPYFDIALDVSKDDSQKGEAIAWVNVYGNSDLVSWGAASLAPGSTVHDEYCLGSTVWVVNLQKETRRQIPVRGKLRVRVSFFPTEESWKKNSEWHYAVEHAGKPFNPFAPPNDIAPEWASIISVSIPCPEATCEPDCDRLPIGTHGENRVVPDVLFLNPDWNERGQALTDKLALRFPPCNEAK